jgi:hypothetical protein
MRRIKELISRKRRVTTQVDEKTIFYFFEKITEEEYGKKGRQSLTPFFLKKKTLGVRAKSPIWANELWLSKGEIRDKINKIIGSDEVREIKIKME